jgi:hypothetical protein
MGSPPSGLEPWLTPQRNRQPEATEDRLRELATEAWRLHAEAGAAASHVVEPSMPILYFGDVNPYRQSAVRIVTVGLNPSREEFPTADPWRRFPEGSTLQPERPDLERYLESLNRYPRIPAAL